MSTLKNSKKQPNFEYIVYGYIRISIVKDTFCPEVLMHIILLYCYLSELLSPIISFITTHLNINEEDIGKMLNRLRYYLQNHHTHQMHLWSEDVTETISLTFISQN